MKKHQAWWAIALCSFALGCGGPTGSPGPVAQRDIGPKAQPVLEQPKQNPPQPKPKFEIPKEPVEIKSGSLVNTVKSDLQKINGQMSGGRIFVRSEAGDELLLGVALVDWYYRVRFLEVKEPDFLLWDGPEIDLSNRGLDYSKFVEVRDGMDELEVFKIVGEIGEIVSTSGNSQNVIWHDGEGGRMVLTFEDGRVTGKTQLGLK